MSTNSTYVASCNQNIDLRQAVKNIDALPAMPVIAQKLLALQINSDENEREMLMLIEQDDKFKAQDLWLHSFGIAFAMLGIARAMPAKIRPKDDQVFLAGILHDIGYLALAFLDPKRSDDLHALLSAESDRPVLSIEREMLEICHDELGAELARHWNLPDEIIAVLRYHHTPDVVEAATGQPIVHMISLAEKLLASFGINEHVDAHISDEDWEVLGIDPSKAEEISVQVAEQAEQAAAVY